MSFNERHHSTIDHSALTGGVVQQSAIDDLGQTISDTYTKAEVQAISDKLDALLAALRSAGVIEASE